MDNHTVIGAYHNYLVNGLLLSDFQLGEISENRFFFEATTVDNKGGEPHPVISANLFDRSGRLLLRLDKSRVVSHRAASKLRRTKSGFSVRSSQGTTLISIRTSAFRNCYCTRFAGTLYDERGRPVASGDWETFRTRADVPVTQRPPEP
jgi:hypothetical protein